jgi:hypothetical protein
VSATITFGNNLPIQTLSIARRLFMKPDPFEEGERAARENIPAEANPYREGSDEYALWAAGHERVAGPAAASKNEGV